MLYYITSNKNKIARAEKYLSPFGVSFIPRPLDLPEIQSLSIEDIAISKAEEAFQTIKEPLFVNDHGWSITALNGFPGAFMKYMNHWLSPQDFLNLMKDKENREMVFTEFVCYTDGNIIKTFSQQVKGHVLYESKGNSEPWSTVSSFSDIDVSIAQVLESQPSAIEDKELWQEFASWLKENKKV